MIHLFPTAINVLVLRASPFKVFERLSQAGARRWVVEYNLNELIESTLVMQAAHTPLTDKRGCEQ
jgi:hypothetical protein